MARTALSKRTRFEVFKRDGFRCIYCGATPVQSALHVDHVVPVVEGGTNDPSNLATACAGCNLGKGGVPLEHKRLPEPIVNQADADHADQIREYLRIQRDVEAARSGAVEAFAEHWERVVGPMSQDMYDRLRSLVMDWPVEKLVEAANITARKMGRAGASYDWMRARQQAKYFHGILRRWRESGLR